MFYPDHLPASERLAYFARHFAAVEIDSTFYHAPALHVAEHWAEVTPPGFVFTAKMPREITHERGLRDCAAEVDAFLDSVRPLRAKLACVLVQLPPYFSPKRDEHTLRDFIRHLPRDIRFAVEFRDADWHHPRIVHLLSEHGVCWVWNDTSTLDHANEAAFGAWPHTTDFLYLRLLGDLGAVMGPRDTALDNWAEKVRALLPQVTRALVFTANHYEGFAPHTASRLAQRLGVSLNLPSIDELTGDDSRQLPLL